MLFEQVEPPEDLKPAVTGIVLLDTPRIHADEQVLPMPTTEIVVNLSAPYVLRAPGGTGGVPTTRVFCTGLRSDVVIFRNPPRLRHVTVRMPAYGPAMLGLTPARRVMPLGGTLGAELNGLAEHAASDDTPLADVASGVVAALRSNLGAESDAQHSVRVTADLLSVEPTHPIGEIAAGLGITHKSLIARFQRIIGTTPSRFARLVMVDRLIAAIPTGGPFPTWTALVAESPYVDQSHFIRSFRRMIGMSPREYLDALTRSQYDDPRFLSADAR